MEKLISAFFIIMHYVYILYSRKLDRYYAGETDDVARRVELHNSGYFKGSYTSAARDRIVRLEIKCKDRQQALSVEKAIKRRSRQYIENLIKYPDLVEKLIGRYS